MITIIIHGVRGSQVQRIVSKWNKNLSKKDHEGRNLSIIKCIFIVVLLKRVCTYQRYRWRKIV